MKEKIAYSESFNNTREVVKFLNANEIPREDIVDILPLKEQLILIYYK